MNQLRTLTATALWLVSMVGYAQSADESAIKTVVEQESVAFHQRKADKVLSYWANVPYASHTYTEKGMGYVRGYETISKAMKNVLGKLPATDKNVYKNHDYRIHINGTSAWATFITDAVDGNKKRQTYDARYLEKIKGVWKLVSVVGIAAP
ncbi:nuclear transport factor 2 family protein [Spirosoma arcticum]